MSDPTATTPDPQRRLEEAMAEYLMAADAGRAPEHAAFLARYPDLRAELAEFLSDQAGLARLVEPLARPGRTARRRPRSHPSGR